MDPDNNELVEKAQASLDDEKKYNAKLTEKVFWFFGKISECTVYGKTRSEFKNRMAVINAAFDQTSTRMTVHGSKIRIMITHIATAQADLKIGGIDMNRMQYDDVVTEFTASTMESSNIDEDLTSLFVMMDELVEEFCDH